MNFLTKLLSVPQNDLCTMGISIVYLVNRPIPEKYLQCVEVVKHCDDFCNILERVSQMGVRRQLGSVDCA